MRIHRFPPIGALLLAALITFGPGAWASHDPDSQGPTPEVHGDDPQEENNPTCAWLGQREEPPQTWNELKIDQAPPNGVYDDQGTSDNPGGPGALSVTIAESDGKMFDWSSEISVDAVVVKGGNNGSNVYSYAPGEESAGKRFHSPFNTKGALPQISHVSFCYDEEEQQQGGDGGGEQNQGGENQNGQPPGDGNGGGDQPPNQGGGDQPQDQGGGDQPQDQGGQQDQDGGQQEQGGGNQNERPQDDGDGEQQDQSDDEPQDQRAQQDQDGDDQPRDDGGQDDGDQQDRGSDDGSETPTERTPEDEVDSDDGSGDQEGDGDVLGESESDDGIAEEGDDSDDEDSDDDDEDEDDRDRLPFTGAPLVFIALIGALLLLTGLVGRRELR